MSEGESPARVGVRELRQNLSVYLRRVEHGETLDVTEHGRMVARLGPTPSLQTGALERMIAEGRATATIRTIDQLPAPARPAGAAASEALRRMRRDERW